MKRPILLALLLALACTLQVKAQQLAYVYIQGDKQTPFYVKLEGAMQERYGKNYCIMSQMAPGPAHLEILFQQNAFPAQQFTIIVPEGGSRGFMLTRRDGGFALYDLQQQFYLPAGNKEADDHLPAIAAAPPPPVVAQAEVPETTAEEAVQEVAPPPVPEKPKREKKQKSVKAEKTETASSDEPRFLNNIELNNAHKDAAVPVSRDIPAEADAANPSTASAPVLSNTFRNSDCPEPIDNATFEKVYKAMMEKSTDEDRIDYLNSQMDRCYQSWHARTLGNMLTEDAARYTFLKKVYPRITDQQAFPLLDDILRSAVWKTQFQQLIHH